jgi:hypothetical protein
MGSLLPFGMVGHGVYVTFGYEVGELPQRRSLTLTV